MCFDYCTLSSLQYTPEFKRPPNADYQSETQTALRLTLERTRTTALNQKNIAVVSLGIVLRVSIAMSINPPFYTHTHTSAHKQKCDCHVPVQYVCVFVYICIFTFNHNLINISVSLVSLWKSKKQNLRIYDTKLITYVRNSSFSGAALMRFIFNQVYSSKW